MQDYEVYAIARRLTEQTPQMRQAKVEDEQQMRGLLDEIEPHIVIHTQCMCNLDVCEEHADKAERVNVAGTRTLLNCLAETDASLVYVSSEHVFSGEKGDYTEEDATDPISVYGRTRVDAEELVRRADAKHLVIRPGLLMGASPRGSVGARDWLRSRIDRGKPATFFDDEYRSPLRVEDFVSGLSLLLSRGCRGVFHLGGEVKFSRYELAQRLLAQWDVPGDIRVKQTADDRTVPRIKDCSLNSEKARQTGWMVPDFFCAQESLG